MRKRLLILEWALWTYHRITVHVYSGKRTKREQLERLLSGATTILKSKHLKGRAADLILKPDTRANYALAGDYWTQLGGIWGGHFKDPKLAAVEYQHFEL